MTIMTRIRTAIAFVSGAVICLAATRSAADPQSVPADSVPPPAINVVYPKENQSIRAVDSTFILGSVTPGSELVINGTPVDVYHTGGFLAFLPVHPGPFEFRLHARYEDSADSLVWPVEIADPSPILPSEGIKIRTGSARPLWNRTVRAGDEITIGFDGTVGCDARFWIAGGEDTLGPIGMTELRSSSLATYQSYRRDALSEKVDLTDMDKPPRQGGGRYRGIWTVPPPFTDDTLRVIIELHGLEIRGLERYRSWPDTVHGPPTPPDTTEITVRETTFGTLTPVDYRAPRVIELTDSVQILRMGPRLGYLTIFQPYGVRARWWGEAGPWTILQPAPGYEAWIETAKTRLLPEGTPLPGSFIARLSTEAHERDVSLRVGTYERLPFKVTVDENLRDIRVLIFGATANTDWIEQDPADDLIETITWTQLQPSIYQIDVTLTQPVWGYDAHYEDRAFVISFRRPPELRAGMKGLTVVVDPGHSADPGAIGPTGLTEKDANLRLAHAVKEQLEDLGVHVVMTRTGDEDVPLYDRPQKAVTANADLFVSVHNNAVPDGINPYRRNGTSTYYYHAFSRDFARHMHKQLLDATSLDDYGLIAGNFAVIRPTQYPSVLLECAFIILPEQEALLLDEDFIQRVADGISEGVSDFIRARLPE
jgi:N-acetylmuramoyl-L-alanine amidase